MSICYLLCLADYTTVVFKNPHLSNLKYLVFYPILLSFNLIEDATEK